MRDQKRHLRCLRYVSLVELGTTFKPHQRRPFVVFCRFCVLGSFRSSLFGRRNLLVEGLGVVDGGRDVGVTDSLVGTGGDLDLVATAVGLREPM